RRRRRVRRQPGVGRDSVRGRAARGQRRRHHPRRGVRRRRRSGADHDQRRRRQLRPPRRQREGPPRRRRSPDRGSVENRARAPPGSAAVEVALPLLLPGALGGRVTSGGQPLANALVTAAPQTAALGTFSVRAGPDGAYRFDKLTPDSYVVSASLAGGFRGNMQTRTVTIASQPTAPPDIDLPLRPVTGAPGVPGP